MLRIRILVVILGLCTILPAQNAPAVPKLPEVKSGDMPFYPSLLRIAQVEGEVDLRVTTDGSGVVSITSDYGNLLLVKAAEDNVRTWKFEKHDPTSFATVFFYHLNKEMVTYSCDPDEPDNGTVILKLPGAVDITSHLRIRDCPEPAEPIDPSRVFFSRCEMDGAPVPCEKFAIRLKSNRRSVAPTWFKKSEQKQGFVVPEDFQSQENFDVSVETGRGKFAVAKLNIGFLKGEWHVGIDHAPFKEGTPVSDDALKAPPGLHCIGYVVFEGEPGVVTYTKCN
jgi:hypothetical protein